MKYLKMIIFLVVATALVSCSQGKKETTEGHAHDSLEAEGHHDKQEARDHGSEMSEESDHEAKMDGGHHDNDDSTEEEKNKIWTPESDGTQSIQTNFHFLTGTIENISPEIDRVDGQNVLKLTLDGTPAAFVFHTPYGNVGMASMVNTTRFTGTLKLIHHAENADNYEFISIKEGKMKLGRVIKGKEKVFDESSFTSEAWTNLRLSAAGTHYKGSIGSKTVTHGHGDKMKDGYVGMMVEGVGVLQLKSMELVSMEDE